MNRVGRSSRLQPTAFDAVAFLDHQMKAATYPDCPPVNVRQGETNVIKSESSN